MIVGILPVITRLTPVDSGYDRILVGLQNVFQYGTTVNVFQYGTTVNVFQYGTTVNVFQYGTTVNVT